LARANPKLPDIPATQHRESVGLMPVDLLLRAVRDETLDMPLRLAAAAKAAPYFHARVTVGPPKAAFEMSDYELDAAIQREKEYIASGRDPGRPEPSTIDGEVIDVDTE